MGQSQKNRFAQLEDIIYQPTYVKSQELVDTYAKTDQFSHRYLAYRDIPRILKKYVSGVRALDYGTGTGISAAFLQTLNFKVVGVDINFLMLEKAREIYPFIQFLEVARLKPEARFDLIFSSFVLFDIKSKAEIVKYLSEASSFLDKKGIFIAITGSEELYSISRDWVAYDSNVPENRNLQSGDLARLKLKDPIIEFRDYFWTKEDYFECFNNSNLDILEVHHPLGSKKDPYLWRDEKFYAPFTVYVLKRK